MGRGAEGTPNYMHAKASRTTLQEILGLRDAYVAEANCQLISYSALPRGIADPYVLLLDDEVAGYAGIWNRYSPGHVSEFFVTLGLRRWCPELFRAFVEDGGATHVELQTNTLMGRVIAAMACRSLRAEKIVFQDGGAIALTAPMPGVTFSEAPDPSPNHPDSRQYRLLVGSQAVVSGGYLCHYNPPYADVYMEVEESMRRKGLGRYFVNAVMEAARSNGKIPAARCNIDNLASRATLLGAGFREVGHIVTGRIRPEFRRAEAVPR